MTEALLIGVVLLALLGTPLFIVIFLMTAVQYAAVTPTPIDLANTFVVIGDLMEKPYLLPIPLFTLAGFLLAESRAPQRLVRLADALFGAFPGGLAIVCVGTLAFFTTFTGASGVTIIALGGMLWPLLLKRGYSERFTLGVITASGSIGLLFFPSLPVFLYVTVVSLTAGAGPGGAITPESLFLAGLFPGMLMVGLLCFYSVWVALRQGVPYGRAARRVAAIEAVEAGQAGAALQKAARGEALTIGERLSEVGKAFAGAFFEATLPIWIIVLLQTGSIGLLDIATVTVAYVFVVEVFIYRDIHFFKDLPRVIGDAMALVGAIVVILAIVIGMNNYLIDQEVPQKILAFLKEHIDSRVAMLLALNIFLLIVGMMMDIFSALVAVLPLIIPLADSYGIHPLHLGVIFLANLEVGYLTPPVGMNLFISSLHFKRPILAVARSVIPFVLLLVGSLAIITYVDDLSLGLPRAFNAPGSGPVVQPGQDPATVPGGGDLDSIDLDSIDLDSIDLDKIDLDAPPGGAAAGSGGAAGGADVDLEGGGGDDLDKYLDPKYQEVPPEGGADKGESEGSTDPPKPAPADGAGGDDLDDLDKYLDPKYRDGGK